MTKSKTSTPVVTKRRTKGPVAPLASLTDADRYDILRRYRKGEAMVDIATHHGIDYDMLKEMINNEMRALSVIQETNKLIQETQETRLKPKAPIELMNSTFLSQVEDRMDAYAWYFAMTGSNEAALAACELDQGIPKNTRDSAKRYALAARGRYLRSIPAVKKEIELIQAERLRDLNVEKPLVQSEIIDQIEQLKEIVADNPSQRSNLLKAIELLGKTIGAFQDNIRVEEVSTKGGLEILMEKALSEAGGTVYEYPEEE